MRTIRVPREDQYDLFLIGLTRFFGDLGASDLTKILEKVDWLEYAAGETVMREGSSASDIFFVVSGRLRAVAETDRGETRLLGEVSRGEALGEIAFISGRPRTATVIAVRATLLVRLTKPGFEEILRDHPHISMRLAGQVVERLDRANARKPLRDRPTSLALVPIGTGREITPIAGALSSSLCRRGRTALVTAAAFRERFPPSAYPGQDEESADVALKIRRWLDELEADHQYLMLLTDEAGSLWTRACLDHADEVLLFVDAARDVAVTTPASALLRYVSSECLAAKRLVLCHSSATDIPRHTARLLSGVDVVGHVHLRKGSATDIDRLARIVSHTAVGLVLSGGGARGFAHLGVYKALTELGTPIDFVGGTSMGAAVGAMIALEMSPDEALESFRRVFNSRLRYDLNFLPLVSLLSGKRLKTQLARVFSRPDGSRVDAEDAWRNFFCIASSYSRVREVVLRRGSLDKLVLASASMPVFLPPVIHGSEVLLDGALINNLPTEEMATLEVGAVIAVDLWRPPFKGAPASDIPTGWRLLGNLFSRARRSRSGVPYLLDVLYNAPMLSSAMRQVECAQSVDVLIQPQLDDMGTLEWGAVDRAVDAGYVAARSRLEALDLSILPWDRDARSEAAYSWTDSRASAT
jgi:NTE family protein